MTTTMPTTSPAWPVAGHLLDALSRRDFDALRGLLAEDIRFRALVPPGLVRLDNADDVAAKFGTWFGGADDFEVLDASIGQVGARVYLRWRVRMCPSERPETGRVAEQHVFVDGTDRVTALDLLCSGFQSDER